MSGQINVQASNTFVVPPSGKRGWKFNALGQPGYVNSEGVFVPLALAVAMSGTVANRGIGDEASLPVSPSTGDVYVTNDTFLVYTAIDGSSWDTRILGLGEFITDTSAAKEVLYQYLGTFVPMAGRGIEGQQDFEATAAQDEFVITDFTVVEGKTKVAKGGLLQPFATITDTTDQTITISPAAELGESVTFIQG